MFLSRIPKFTILVSFLITELLWHMEAVPMSNVTISKHPIILVVSYDGFRHDYLQRVKTETLDSLRRNGVTVPYMQPVFPTKTFPNHQSIATGVFAETHGIVDNTLYDRAHSKTFSGFTDDPGFWNYHPEVLPMWIYNEKAGDGRVSGCFMWPGSSQAYGQKNDLLPTYYRHYNGSVPWEERVDTVISWITNNTHPANLVFMYYDEPDTHGHVFGPNYEETLEEVSKVDSRTTYLLDKLKEATIFDQVNLIVLSDHGMQDVTQERIIYIDALVADKWEIKHGGTPLLQFIPKQGKEDELFEILSNHSAGNNYDVWKKEDIPTELYYTTTRRVLDLVVLAKLGYAFDDFNRTINRYKQMWNLTEYPTRQYGVHGYTNQVPSMRPLFIGHGPTFRKGFEFPPIKNVDVVPLISTILNITDVPSNGSLRRVIDMIEPKYLPRSRNVLLSADSSKSISRQTLHIVISLVILLKILSH